MIWFIVGGLLMVLWRAARNIGGLAGYVPAILPVAQTGVRELLRFALIFFVIGAAVFGTPLWLLFG